MIQKSISIVITFSFFLLLSAYDKFAINANMRISSFAFTKNQQYMIVPQKIEIDYTTMDVPDPKTLPILIYKLTRTGYQLVNKVYGPETAKKQPSGPISTSDGRNMFSIPWNDSYVRIYSLQNSEVRQVQRIYSQKITNAFINTNGNIFIYLSNYFQFVTMNYNTESLKYVPAMNSTIRSLNYGISPDAACIVFMNQYVNISIFNYNGVEWRSFSHINQILLAQYNKATTNKILVSNYLDDLSRNVIVVLQQQKVQKASINVFMGSQTYFVYYLLYCKLDSAGLNFVQEIDILDQNPIFYLSKNGKYLAVTFSTYRKQIILYRFDNANSRYYYYQKFWNIQNFLSNVFVNQEGTMIAGTSQLARNATTQQIVFFITCPILHCHRCLWGMSCDICNPGFVKSGNICVCSDNKIFHNGKCIQCKISHCYLCHKPNICQKCIDGYSLVEGYCLCPSFKSISSINGKCVSCDIQGCLKCQVDDVCSLYSDELKNKHITFLPDIKQKISKEQEKEYYRSIELSKQVVNDESIYDDEKDSKQNEMYLDVKADKVEIIEGIIIICLLIIICLCNKCGEKGRKARRQGRQLYKLNDKMQCPRKQETINEMKQSSKNKIQGRFEEP